MNQGHAMRITQILMLFVLAALAVPASAQTIAPPVGQTQIEALHAELRAVKNRLVQAVNKKDSAALAAELTPGIAFTAINNDTVIGIDKVKAYYDKMLNGSSRFLNDFSIASEADGPSQLFADNKMAIATGRSDAKLDLRAGSGMKYTVPLRWTATLDRSSGQWKLAAIHFSADLSDNPYLTALSKFWKWAATGIGLVGLSLGFFMGLKRRGAKT
jgi:ketosteroid isomerase-like protein